jgi:hypothetical protein
MEIAMDYIVQYKKPAGVEFWELLPSSESDFNTLKEYHRNHWGDRFQILGVSTDDANLYTYQFINTSESEMYDFYEALRDTVPYGTLQQNKDEYVFNHQIEMILDWKL